MTAIPLDWNTHKHLLWGRKPVFATPNGLIGGGWEVPRFIEEWRREAGIGPIEFRMRTGDSEVITFEVFHRKEAEAVFCSENDAFMFKMKWL
jgi:hypothetical protein